MGKIGIIYGSDTGCTEDVTQVLKSKLEETRHEIEVLEVHEKFSAEHFRKFDLLFLGIPTWYDGDLQSDWEDFFPTFEKVDFSGQIVAIYGLGDQIGYDEYFVDGVGILAKTVIDNGGTVIGNWSADGYDHTESKALLDEHTFYGLAIDEDNEPELTEGRIDDWIDKVQKEWREEVERSIIALT
ncbi:MAG: flavodoxin [Bacteroidota bacterium]